MSCAGLRTRMADSLTKRAVRSENDRNCGLRSTCSSRSAWCAACRTFPAGSSSSMGRKPKLFIRDSGVLHALLGIESSAQLRSHRDIGGSFESYVGESLISAGTERCGAQFYRKKGREGED